MENIVKKVLYTLSALGLGVLLVFSSFIPGVMLSLLVPLPSNRSMNEIIIQGGLVGLVLHLGAPGLLQRRHLRELPVFSRALCFFVLPATLVILFGKVAYFETGLALAVIAAPPLYSVLTLFDRRD